MCMYLLCRCSQHANVAWRDFISVSISDFIVTTSRARTIPTLYHFTIKHYYSTTVITIHHTLAPSRVILIIATLTYSALDCIFLLFNQYKPSRLMDYRFKPVGRPIRRPSATNGGSMPRGDEEGACAHKLDHPQLPRKAPVESTAVAYESDVGPMRSVLSDETHPRHVMPRNRLRLEAGSR
jgi:hypothetical protein